MQLTALELNGFKSFARKTSFQFDPGITAVIGPNGSGKSNLAESIRWVLGEQSLKNLRGKSSDDVIFAGSGSGAHRRSGQAQVSLTLNNESGRLPVDAAEVTITRSINRSGEGEYLINGDPVRLLDIQQMLAEAGLGTKSYAVISQGTVDKYLSATPAARRELFDEATGVKALQLKLGRAERNLIHVEERLQELRTVLAELEPRLRILKRQAMRYEQRQDLEKKYNLMQEQWYQKMWHELNRARITTKSLFDATQDRIMQARHAREQVEADILGALENTSDSKEATQESTASQLRQELLRAEQEYERNRRAYEQRRDERQELETSLKHIQSTLKQARAQLEAARSYAEPHNLLAHLGSLLKRVRSFLAGEESVTADVLIKEITKALQRLETDDDALASAQSIVDRLEGPLRAVARFEAIEAERLSQLQKLTDLPEPQDAEVRSLRAKLKNENSSQVDKRAQLEQALTKVRSEELNAEREGSAASAAIDQANNDLEQLEREIRRERGTKFLAELENSPPSEQELSIEETAVRRLAAQLHALGETDPLIMKEYSEVSERYSLLSQQLADVEDTREKTKTMIRSLRQEVEVRFRQQFAALKKSFNEYFQKLFGGGVAQIEIVEAEAGPEGDDANELRPVQGIEIVARPPGKKPQHIGLLSGGEKTLTSLALLLAIVDIQHPPFLVLDEVDAALDEANSYRFAEVLHSIGSRTQCIVVTHNRETMGQANVLYGITMNSDGVSQSYSVRLADIKETETFQI